MNKLKEKLVRTLKEHKGEALLLFRIEQSKLFDEIPLFIETASEEELQEAIKETLQGEANEFLKFFENNPYIHDRIVSHDTIEAIRYGFLYYCILNKLDTISYDDFQKFSEKYNIKDEVIILWEGDDIEDFDQDMSYEDVLEASNNSLKPSKSETFKFIAEVTTDLAVDQNPREFKDFVHFIDKDGNELKSKAYGAYENRMTQYEQETVQYLFGFKNFHFKSFI